MRDFRDAKTMAQTLRDALKAKSVSLTRSESLEIIAKTLGFHDWNVLAAAIQASEPAEDEQRKIPVKHGGDSICPVIPLRDLVVFPQMVVPLFVGRDKTKRAIESALACDGTLLVVTQRRARDDDPSVDDLYPVGVKAKVIHCMPLDDGTVKIFASGLRRVGIKRVVENEFMAAETAAIEDVHGEPSEETRALSCEIAEAYKAYAKNFETSSAIPASALRPPPLFLGHFTKPGVLADTAAPLVQMLMSPGIESMQQILQTTDVVARLRLILEVMKMDRLVA